jgi:hypothetical protein
MIDLCRADDFGGASVTMPIKVAVVDHLDRLTSEAIAIGAVNTIVPEYGVSGTVELVGTNTYVCEHFQKSLLILHLHHQGTGLVCVMQFYQTFLPKNGPTQMRQ